MEDLRINNIPSQYFSYGNPGGWSSGPDGEGAAAQNSARPRSLSPRARDLQPIDTDQELLRRRDVFGNVHAPFGTEQTPPLKVKIIGGRYVTVLEKPPPSSRDVEPLRAQGAMSNRLHEMLSPRDSMAQRELGRPPPLPPIATVSRKVIEGPPQQQEVIVRDFAYKLPPAGVSTARGQHLPLPAIGDNGPSPAIAHALSELLQKLPHDRYLPSAPIHIDSVHYVGLLHELEQQLSHVTATALQQVYIELTTFDRSLSGEVKFNDLSLVFSRNGVFLKPEILRLLGALFVASAEGGVGTKVNYEKIVSFLSACLKFFADKKHRNLLADGAEMPLPPFELLASMTQSQSQPHSQSLMDSGLGSTGPPQHAPHLPDRDTAQRVMQESFNFAPPPPPPPPPHALCPKCHSQDCQCANGHPLHNMREEFEQRGPKLPEAMPEKLRLELLEKMREGPPPMPHDFAHTMRNQGESDAKKEREEAEYSHYLQLANEQITRLRRPFDTEALRLQFQRADRIMRGTLSVGQIVDLSQQSGIPLEPSLVADIVRNLCPHRGGGQYDWLAFQAFVDKLKPQQTSLNVGSMRPDRVMTVREPLPTWPYADPGSLPRLAQPENRDEDHEPPKYYQSMPSEASYRATERARLTQMDSLRMNLESQYQNQAVPDLAVAGNRTGAVANLLEQFQLTARSKGGKWMERFMQLAAAVYEGVDAQGFSKPSMVRHVTRQYADTLRLMIADIDIDDALRYARTVDGRVDTHLYLKRLCRNKVDG